MKDVQSELPNYIIVVLCIILYYTKIMYIMSA